MSNESSNSDSEEYLSLIFHAPLESNKHIVEVFCKALNTVYPEADCCIDYKSEKDLTRIIMNPNVDKQRIDKLAKIVLVPIADISYKTTIFL